MGILISWIIFSVSLMLTAYFVPGFQVASFKTALVVSFVIGLLNITIKPVLKILTLPITILTLGLFTLVINALLLEIASFFVSGFVLDNFFPTAILGGIILSITNAILNKLFR